MNFFKILLIFFNKYKSNNLLASAVKLTFGTAISQLITIFTTFLLTRLYSPSEFGIFALYSSVLTITSVLVSLSYPIRIVLPKLDREAQDLCILSILLSLIIASFLFGISILLPNSFLELIGLKDLGSFLTIAIFVGAITSVSNSLSYLLNRRSNYREIINIKLIQSIISSVLALIFGSLVIKKGLIYANVFSLLIILLLSYHYTRIDFKSIRIKQLLIIGKAHKSGPINLFPTALLDVISMQLPIFMITVWFSKEIAAQYRIAYAMLSLPASFIGSAVAQVFYQKFSEIWPDAKTALSLLKKTWLALALVGIIPMLVIMLFGQILIPFLLGESWVIAGSIASILVVMTFFSLIHSPTSVTLITMGYENIMPFFGTAAIVHRPLALYIGHLQNNVLYAIFYFVLFEVLHMLIFQFIVLKKLKQQLN